MVYGPLVNEIRDVKREKCKNERDDDFAQYLENQRIVMKNAFDKNQAKTLLPCDIVIVYAEHPVTESVFFLQKLKLFNLILSI